METLNIQVEIPVSTVFDIDELERQLSDYAKKFIASRTSTYSYSENVTEGRKRRPLSPIVQSLIGVAKGADLNDINGITSKEDYLIEKYNESVR